MHDVISINGGKIAPSGGVSEPLVGKLEELLRQAKDGRIKGMGAVFMLQDNSAEYTLVGFCGGFAMMGACDMVKSEIVKINNEPYE